MKMKNIRNNNNLLNISKLNFFRELKTNCTLFIMLIPAIVFFLLFSYIPMIGIILAFKNYNFIQGIFSSPWSGWKNFEFLANSGILIKVTRNTILYNLAFFIVETSLSVILSIFIAGIIGKYYKKICQSVIFLPHFISFVILSAFVYNLFNYEFGTVNTILTSLGFDRVDIYGMPKIWPFIIVMFKAWKSVGYASIIYLAAIMGINPELYEVAKLDGANVFQRVRYITLPSLLPTMIILFILRVGRIMRGQFQLFYQIVGNNARLFDATDVIDTYVFRSLVDHFDVGRGTAASLYQSFFGLLLVIITNYIIKKIEPDYSLF